MMGDENYKVFCVRVVIYFHELTIFLPFLRRESESDFVIDMFGPLQKRVLDIQDS